MIYGLIDQGTLWLPLMILLGATLGLFMGLTFPFVATTKIAMIVGLITSLLGSGLSVQQYSSLFYHPTDR